MLICKSTDKGECCSLAIMSVSVYFLVFCKPMGSVARMFDHSENGARGEAGNGFQHHKIIIKLTIYSMRVYRVSVRGMSRLL